MKIFHLLPLMLVLVLSASSQTANSPSAAPNLEFSLEVKTTPVVPPQTDNKAVKYHVSFDLAVKNKGLNEYKPSEPIQKLWKLVILQQPSGKTVAWHWTLASADIKCLGAGEVGHSQAEWDDVNDVESGNYIATAIFDQRSDFQSKQFSLPPPPLNADILFTGRLMGYYRLPDRQKFKVEKDARCILDEKEASPDARIFFHEFPYNSSDHQIRVGMGDNFAPNYYSRAFSDPPPEPEQAGKDMYYWDTLDPEPQWKSDPMQLRNIDDVREGRGTIPTDNVACFLARAHYDAIVPGTLDFHYGPERVRELARLLASIPKNGDFQPVQMLAANVMIKTSWTKDHASVPDREKPQLPFLTKFRHRVAVAGDKSSSQNADFTLEVTNIPDGSFVFPWMQFIQMEAKGVKQEITAPIVSLCQAAKDDPDNFLNEAKDCKDGKQLALKDKTTDKGTTKLVYRFIPANFDAAKNSDGPVSVLVPGQNYAICTTGPKEIRLSSPYCVRFSVYTPFFQYPDWPKVQYPDWSKEGRSDDKGPEYTNPGLYLLKNDRDGQTPVVIFGIVDPQMLENIGGDNYTWQTVRNDQSKTNWPFDKWEKEYKTEVTITDPIPTLSELQRYFEQDYCFHHHGKPFQGIRVLLAQMRPEQAKELAEHVPKGVRFDVIVSAADNALATPNQNAHFEPAMVTTSEQPDSLTNTACLFETGTMQTVESDRLLTPTSFVAVPSSHDAANPRYLQAREMHIESDGHTYWNYQVTGAPKQIWVPPIDGLQCAAKQFWDPVYDRVGMTHDTNPCKSSTGYKRDPASEKAAIQQLTLLVMRNNASADVTLLQDKDFYVDGLDDYFVENCAPKPGNPLGQDFECGPQHLPAVDIQQILERIIWKGDFIKTRSVTGTGLKAILKESEQFVKTEKAGYIPIGERRRYLVMLGVRSDPSNSSDYLINGKPVDPNALYTVATSDYIATGDTGYPELAKPPVGTPDPAAVPRGKVYRISGLVCAQVSLYPKQDCDREILAKELFDRAADKKPDDPRAGNTNLHKFYAWLFLRPRLGQHVGLSRDLPAATRAEAVKAAMQKKVEKDTTWNWSFDKLSIGFSGLSHTGTEEAVSQKFSGVLSPGAASPHNHSWDWDANSKLIFYRPETDWFISDILQYSSKFVAQVPGPRSETQPRNQFVLEGGNYLHLHPWRGKELPQLSLALYGHLETLVGSPITTLKINGISSPLVFDQGRTFLLLGRSGLRWENRKSYIEAGLEGGGTLNAIQQFNILTAPGGPTVPCQLEAQASLTTCINKFNQDHPATPVTNTSTVDVQRNPQPRYGAYWTMKVTVPINDTVSYNFQDFSDYFFLSTGDNSADTRFRHQLIHTLKFMVFPNLSFEPTYTLFFYENKLDYNFLLQQQYSIKINYSFNFTNRHEWKRQFMYKKP